MTSLAERPGPEKSNRTLFPACASCASHFPKRSSASSVHPPNKSPTLKPSAKMWPKTLAPYYPTEVMPSQIGIPSPEPENPALRNARLGYRARYIHQCACFLRDNPNWLNETAKQPIEQARQRLISLPGVGPKSLTAYCSLEPARWKPSP